MENLEFLVVQDVYEDVETNKYAHVFLPAAVWAEKEGCHHQHRAAREPHAQRAGALRRFQARLLDLQRDGQALRGPQQDPLSRDAGRRVRGNEASCPKAPDARSTSPGMSYDRIEAAARHPVALQRSAGAADKQRSASRRLDMKQRQDFLGNPRLYTDGVFQTPDGRAKLIPVRFVDNNERPGHRVPVLAQLGPRGRAFPHPHAHRQDRQLQQVQPDAVHGDEPRCGRRAGHRAQSYVRLVSRRGDAVVMVQLTHRVPPRHGVHPVPLPRLRQPPDARPARPVFAPARVQAERGAGREGSISRKPRG